MDIVHLDNDDYRLLAEFRRALRRFLRFSEAAAAKVGLTAQHYQALLALRGAGSERLLTINDLARELLIRHNSAVGLVDRLEKRGLIERRFSATDGRKVELVLTDLGRHLLERLAGVHQQELQGIGPQLTDLLEQITHATTARERRLRSHRRREPSEFDASSQPRARQARSRLTPAE